MNFTFRKSMGDPEVALRYVGQLDSVIRHVRKAKTVKERRQQFTQAVLLEAVSLLQKAEVETNEKV